MHRHNRTEPTTKKGSPPYNQINKQYEEQHSYLVTFQFFPGCKVKDSYPQITSSCHKFLTRRMQRCPTFFSKVNRHRVGMEHLASVQIPETDLASGGNRHDSLPTRNGGDFQITDLFGSNLKGMQKLGLVPNTDLAVGAGTQQGGIADPDNLGNGSFLWQLQGRFGFFVTTQEQFEIKDSQQRFFASSCQGFGVGRKNASLDDVLVGQFHQGLSRYGIPNPRGKITRSSSSEVRHRIDLTTPHGALVALKGSDPVSGNAIAEHRHFVVTGTQQKRALLLWIIQVLQFCERTSVSGTDDRDLGAAFAFGRHGCKGKRI